MSTPPPTSDIADQESTVLERLAAIAAQKPVDAETFEKGVADVDGVVLFKIALAGTDAARWVAAIALKGDETNDIAIVETGSETGEPRVEWARDSDLPAARIASAYAGLAETWKRAA